MMSTKIILSGATAVMSAQADVCPAFGCPNFGGRTKDIGCAYKMAEIGTMEEYKENGVLPVWAQQCQTHNAEVEYSHLDDDKLLDVVCYGPRNGFSHDALGGFLSENNCEYTLLPSGYKPQSRDEYGKSWSTYRFGWVAPQDQVTPPLTAAGTNVCVVGEKCRTAEREIGCLYKLADIDDMTWNDCTMQNVKVENRYDVICDINKNGVKGDVGFLLVNGCVETSPPCDLREEWCLDAQTTNRAELSAGPIEDQTESIDLVHTRQPPQRRGGGLRYVGLDEGLN